MVPGPKPAAPIVEYKRSLANLAKHDITQLTALVKSRLRRMQYRPDLIAGFLAGTRLDFTPLSTLRNRRSLLRLTRCAVNRGAPHSAERRERLLHGHQPGAGGRHERAG